MVLVAGLGLAQAQPKVKDQAEFDLYTSITKETDPTKKITLLDQWTEKYPDTEFKQARNLFYAQTYAALAVQGQQPNATPDQLAAAEKAAHTLIDKADTFFSPEMKMSTVTDAQWKEARSTVLMQANQSLAAIAVAKKDYPAAEAQYRKMLELNPNDAATAYLLGTSIANQHVVTRTPEALFYFARAATITGPGALAGAGQQQTDAYLKRAYVGYHGAPDGLDELKAMAAKTPTIPPDFKLKSVTEVQQEQFGNEEAFNKAHPQIVLWRNLRTELTGANGETYFNSSMKGAEMKDLKGKVVAQPNQKELTVAIDNVTTETMTKPEAKLIFDSPLKGTVEPGTEITFAGTATTYAKDPFMVTFDVEKKAVSGLGAAAGPAAPAHRAAPVHRKK